MSKIYVRQMNLRRWFTPKDRYAACVARLCILREDFALEIWGLYATSIKRLDGHSVVWRRIYFWRNLVRTLGEIRRTIETLNTVPEFKKVFKAQPVGIRKKFEEMVKKLEKDQSLVQNMRDSLGGHVLQRTVEQALNALTSPASPLAASIISTLTPSEFLAFISAPFRQRSSSNCRAIAEAISGVSPAKDL